MMTATDPKINEMLICSLTFIQDDNKPKLMLGSYHTINETIKIIEGAAMDVSLLVARTNNFNIQISNFKFSSCFFFNCNFVLFNTYTKLNCLFVT